MLRGIDAVDAAAEHSHGEPARVERAAMADAVHTPRHTADYHRPRS